MFGNLSENEALKSHFVQNFFKPLLFQMQINILSLIQRNNKLH